MIYAKFKLKNILPDNHILTIKEAISSGKAEFIRWNFSDTKTPVAAPEENDTETAAILTLSVKNDRITPFATDEDILYLFGTLLNKDEQDFEIESSENNIKTYDVIFKPMGTDGKEPIATQIEINLDKNFNIPEISMHMLDIKNKFKNAFPGLTSITVNVEILNALNSEPIKKPEVIFDEETNTGTINLFETRYTADRERGKDEAKRVPDDAGTIKWINRMLNKAKDDYAKLAGTNNTQA